MERHSLSLFILRQSLRSFSIFLLIYNHSNPFESLYLYPSLSIFISSYIIFTYISSSISNHPNHFKSHFLYPSLHVSLAYLRLSFSILFGNLGFLLIFLNLYLLIHVIPFLYLSFYLNYPYPFESQSSIKIYLPI